MNIAIRLSKLHTTYTQIKKEIDKLSSDKYTFCMHYHYDLPIVSVWPRDENSNLAIRFEIDLGTISKKEGGLFYTDIQVAEMKAILIKWLSSDLHV